LRDRHHLQLHVSFALKPLRAEGASLYLIGQGNGTELRRFRSLLPGRSARLDLIDGMSGEIAGVGRYQGDGYRGEILLPLHNFDPHRLLFVKLDRRVWFFDEAGWLSIAALPRTLAVRRELAAVA
jgi:hypothetical protein